MTISVVPRPLIEDPPMIYGFNYSVQQFLLGKEITFNVILVDQNGSPLTVNQVTLSGDDYSAWGQDDMYVVDYICRTLGLLLQPSPSVVPDIIEIIPVDPAPVDPAPVDPVPVDPVPVDPEPVDPVPVDPEPVDPVPVDPVPVDPAPVDPVPVDPVPVEPTVDNP